MNAEDGGNQFAFYSEGSLIVQKIGGGMTNNAGAGIANDTVITVPLGAVATGSANTSTLGTVKGMASVAFNGQPAAAETITIGANVYTFVAGTPAPATGNQIAGTIAGTLQSAVNTIKKNETNFTADYTGNFLQIRKIVDTTDTLVTTASATNKFAIGSTNSAVNNIVLSGTASPALTFNGKGEPAADGIQIKSMNVNFWNGALDMDGGSLPLGSPAVTLNLGTEGLKDGMTQGAGDFGINYINQNGAKFGNFSGVTIDSTGVVTALFDNGVRTPVFQIPVATFSNPNGLESLTGNTWIETTTSGAYTLRTAGQA
ncbi:MAG: flagellar hook-basal body complex protein, partial [Rhodospirillales bacterium]|nr:flagellar hook-basal body complex protein [Rhodospirillales bacterium]